MAFSLDCAGYPDTDAFWAAAGPHYSTIFQPDATRLLTSRSPFPLSDHADQYGEKAFPYCEAVLLLHAGAIQGNAKLAQVAQTTALPATLNRLAAAHVPAGTGMTHVASRNEAIPRSKDIRGQIIGGGDRASLVVLVADIAGGDVSLPLPDVVRPVSAAAFTMQALEVGDVCATDGAGALAEWAALVGIEPLRPYRYDAERPLGVLLSPLYRLRVTSLSGCRACPFERGA